MPDYIYLLENRLSADQQNALRQLREAAREAGMILFLTGDAVRDLTSGHAVHDLEVSVHGNALKLKKNIDKLGGVVWGESEASHTLYLCFPGTVRVDVVSTHRLDYANLNKPVYHPASIQEDLRRRDFTVNAMAISLNEGSFGLLMDPLNGAADIEARLLRLVSNYGFLEEPSLLIRATRYIARLGWELDPKTRTRYDNAKEEGVIERLSAEARSKELEQISHEDEGLKVLNALEQEGWMNVLFPPWTSAKADEEKLKALHDLSVELLVQGIHADMSAAQMQLLTAKMSPKDLTALKKLMLRPGFVEEWNSLDALAAKFAKVLLSKENSTASAGFKLFTSYDPEAVLWLGFTSKDKAVQERFNQFLKVWPEARQRIPHALMQEMRITPDLATYKEIVQAIFLELIDGKLIAPEEIRAFLEPHSPPAPPPQVTVKRPRAKRGEAKLKERTYDDDEEPEDDLEVEEDLDDLGGEDEDIDLGMNLPKVDLEPEIGDELESDHGEDDLDADDLEGDPVEEKRGARSAVTAKGGKKAKEAPTKPSKKESLAEALAPVQATAGKPEKAEKPPASGKEKVVDPKAKAASKIEPAAKIAAHGKTPAVATKVHAPATGAKTVPAAIPAKASKPVLKKTAPAPTAKPVKGKVQAKAAPKKTAPAKGKTIHKAPAKTVKKAAHPIKPAKPTKPVKKAPKKR